MTRSAHILLGSLPFVCAVAAPVLGEGDFGAFEKLRASATASAEASGRLRGEIFDVPAATSRSESDDLGERPLSGSIIAAPRVGFVSGTGAAGYTAGADRNVISGSASGVVSAKRADDDKDGDNSMLLTATSTVTFDFTLVRTVVADLAVALQRDDGYTQVRTSLSGPATHPQLDLARQGDASQKLILPPGDYHLTFMHLTGASVDKDDDEAESQGAASFSLALDPCGADCNGDNTLNVLDFICFQAMMNDKADQADVNADGRLDIMDMIVFQELFTGGCD
jgi:hypothetical protein